jgi:uncharacterized membrane protein YfcA
MFRSRVFAGWCLCALALWVGLFSTFDSLRFLVEHWYYPAMMVAGAFVAGFTPEGGGAVAFPVLNVFLHVDRVLARDFSMMIQSVGMTSASVFILSHKDTVIRDFKPLFAFIPVCILGFLLGMLLLQQIHVFLIQAFYLSLSATFVTAYFFSDHRGSRTQLQITSGRDVLYLAVILIIGGMFSSLFGTGADVVVYTLLVTRLSMTAKMSTRMSIVLQASVSLFGYGYRAFVDHGLTSYQIKTWLCAYPVVLFMAPFGAYVLSRLHVNWMLKTIIGINVFQLLYFNLSEPSVNKVVASTVFSLVLSTVFFYALGQMARNRKSAVG